MTKYELAKNILSQYDDQEWEDMENNTLDLPVNEHNRNVHLELRDAINKYEELGTLSPKERRRFSFGKPAVLTLFEGDIEGEKVIELKSSLEEYLDEVWAEARPAHKYIVNASLALTFILERPMHPESSVHFLVRVEDGKNIYYCPHKENSLICSYCKCRFADELYKKWDEKEKETKECFGDLSSKLQHILFEAGFQECRVIKTSELDFHDEVRTQCEKNSCRQYGRTWACPPAVGTVAECKERVLKYSHMMLFSKAYVLADTMDLEEMARTMSDFKKQDRKLDDKLKDLLKSFQILSNESCDRCKKCSYPGKPCRFPDTLHHSIEGYGFNVLELSRKAAMKYINGQSTATFFGAVLYNEDKR